MIAVLTGDVINSTKHSVNNWLTELKNILNKYGQTPNEWEIFRGDSFQLKTTPKKALLIALHIKASLKQIKDLDVRIAIGIGKEEFKSSRITEANGSAYINSGKCFESLQKQNLAIKSQNSDIDKTINLMLNLISLTLDDWTPTVSEAIKKVIEYPAKNQQEIAKLLGKSQSSLSELLNRGGLNELLKLNAYYINCIQEL